MYAKDRSTLPGIQYSSLQVYGMFRGFRRAWKFLALILGVSSKTYLKNVTDFSLFLYNKALCYNKQSFLGNLPVKGCVGTAQQVPTSMTMRNPNGLHLI
jgi:hypothetical protein